MTKQEILDILVQAGATTPEEIISVLQDGEALGLLGITDKDQAAIEELHAEALAAK